MKPVQNHTIPSLRPDETLTLTAGIRGYGYALSIWHRDHLVAATILDREALRALAAAAIEVTQEIAAQVEQLEQAHGAVTIAMNGPDAGSVITDPGPLGPGAWRMRIPEEMRAPFDPTPPPGVPGLGPDVDDTIRAMGRRFAPPHPDDQVCPDCPDHEMTGLPEGHPDRYQPGDHPEVV